MIFLSPRLFTSWTSCVYFLRFISILCDAWFRPLAGLESEGPDASPQGHVDPLCEPVLRRPGGLPPEEQVCLSYRAPTKHNIFTAPKYPKYVPNSRWEFPKGFPGYFPQTDFFDSFVPCPVVPIVKSPILLRFQICPKSPGGPGPSVLAPASVPSSTSTPTSWPPPPAADGCRPPPRSK